MYLKNRGKNFKISYFCREKSFFTPDLEGKKKRKKFQNFQFRKKSFFTPDLEKKMSKFQIFVKKNHFLHLIWKVKNVFSFFYPKFRKKF